MTEVFDPTMQVLPPCGSFTTSLLQAGSSCTNWSGKGGSNSRPQPWQGCALPTELFPRGRRILRNAPKESTCFVRLFFGSLMFAVNCDVGLQGLRLGKPEFPQPYALSLPRKMGLQVSIRCVSFQSALHGIGASTNSSEHPSTGSGRTAAVIGNRLRSCRCPRRA